MDKKRQEYIGKIEREWRPFLEKIADQVHPRNPECPGWSPEDESWLELVQHLDGVAAGYVAWQSEGISVNEYGALDDDRVLELIEPCGLSEADRRVYLMAYRQAVEDWRRLQEIENEGKNNGPDTE